MPAQRVDDALVVAVIAADVDGLALGREGHDLVVATSVHFHHHRGEVAQTHPIRGAQIEGLAVGALIRGAEQQSLHHVVHVVEVADLQAVAEDAQRLAIQQAHEPDAEKCLAVILDAHPGAVGVRQPQDAGAHAVDAMVEEMVAFPGDLVDAVDVHGRERMILVHRQIARHAVNLARAREDHADGRIALAAGFEDGQLRAAIDFQVGLRIAHAIEVAGLPGEVEKVVLPGHEVVDAVGIAHVGDVDLHPAAQVLDVEGVAAVFGDEAVDQGYVRARRDEPPRKVGADKAQAAGDEHIFALQSGLGNGGRRWHERESGELAAWHSTRKSSTLIVRGKRL